MRLGRSATNRSPGRTEGEEGMARVMSGGTRRVLLAVATFVATVAAVGAASPAQAAGTGEIRYAGSARAVAGSYIVVLKAGSTSTASAATSLVSRHGGSVRQVYGAAVRGFNVSATVAAARALAADPAVAYVEQDQVMSIDATQ